MENSNFDTDLKSSTDLLGSPTQMYSHSREVQIPYVIKQLITRIQNNFLWASLLLLLLHSAWAFLLGLRESLGWKLSSGFKREKNQLLAGVLCR